MPSTPSPRAWLLSPAGSLHDTAAVRYTSPSPSNPAFPIAISSPARPSLRDGLLGACVAHPSPLANDINNAIIKRSKLLAALDEFLDDMQ